MFSTVHMRRAERAYLAASKARQSQARWLAALIGFAGLVLIGGIVYAVAQPYPARTNCAPVSHATYLGTATQSHH